ncbi:hypothetical protein [Streptomyces sp. AP-93]|uniref:hypothetical protein n=1 Tax=Streptomyces sp. AP-93 TaxID=2929048 RepID=UPI001FAEDCDD|nr:hypothetical protein [Streptomyces sp. AP-93]MCJ0869707.1 hypothetical protein [Streptomyces sp. AP-93]
MKRTAQDPRHLLGVYLNDHLAGAGAGIALVKRTARAHRGTDAGPRLAALAGEISEDRDSLREVMMALDVPANDLRMLLGMAVAQAGRLKPNGRLLSRSPLSDVLELEAIRLGVEGNKELWRTLHTLARSDPLLDAEAMGRLLARAERQADTLEALRLAAVGRALRSAPGAAPAAPRHGAGRAPKAGWAS